MMWKTTAAVAPVLMLGCLAQAAQAVEVRNYLKPDVANVPDPDSSSFGGVNYGHRARVRIIRPDGVYPIRQEYGVRAPSTEAAPDVEMKDN